MRNWIFFFLLFFKKSIFTTYRRERARDHPSPVRVPLGSGELTSLSRARGGRRFSAGGRNAITRSRGGGGGRTATRVLVDEPSARGYDCFIYQFSGFFFPPRPAERDNTRGGYILVRCIMLYAARARTREPRGITRRAQFVT